jgi:hypothetical protein
MFSAIAHKPSLLDNKALKPEPSEKRRSPLFSAFSALAAPFKDMDDRALHKKLQRLPLRNNSKGNLFHVRAKAPAKGPAR